MYECAAAASLREKERSVTAFSSPVATRERSSSIITLMRAGLALISAPRKTPLMDALRGINIEISGLMLSRPALPTQETRPR